MNNNHSPQTLFEKIWHKHEIMVRDDGQALLYVDQHLLQDGSAPGFEMLRQRHVKPRMPSRSFAVPDHFIPTSSRDLSSITDAEKRNMALALANDTANAGIKCFWLDDPRQGIVHVVAPEQGLSHPGSLIVCGDSHTSTHGALGALAFGIGATEVCQVLGTQAIWQRKPKTMRISVKGKLSEHVSAKDVILAIIARIGAGGAVGHAVEYAGEAIKAMSIEARLTLCNMSIESGARAGMIAPDEKTFSYLAGRPYSPKGEKWDKALQYWQTLFTDENAVFDKEIVLDVSDLSPMVSWGISPEHAVSIAGKAPHPKDASNDDQAKTWERALAYMGLTPGMSMTDVTIDQVFIGSCTNGRIEDLRVAAEIVKGQKVANGVKAWVVPGSGLVRKQAEEEGLDEIFKEAGFEWRYAGCSMCLGTNGDVVLPGKRCASTTNRNFMGRQGPESRTHLLSPATAAASAITGRLTDVRQFVTGAL